MRVFYRASIFCTTHSIGIESFHVCNSHRVFCAKKQHPEGTPRIIIESCSRLHNEGVRVKTHFIALAPPFSCV